MTSNHSAAAGRLLVVSNRLPFTLQLDGDQVQLQRSPGGLATGLSACHAASDGVWVGWPGDASRFSAPQRDQLAAALRQSRVVPVWLSQDDVKRYYEGFSNRVLWPLCHYLVDRVPVESSGWEAYRAVNEKFADAVVREYRDGDSIWVHDYQLMLVPALLRARLPRARIGFFLHIPFPSSEVFRILPWREQLLHGLLGADLIGFHTFAYLRHFVAALLHVEGIEAAVDVVPVGDRQVRLGVFPMGIDAAGFAALAADPAVAAQAKEIRRETGERRLLLGIDRLDYTKGIPRRLHAIERLLSNYPEYRDTVRYVQVAVPTRAGMEPYQTFRRQVEEAVGRINGAYGTFRSTPVHYLHRACSPADVAALYCAADVMLVTPLRDGLNLVAKEFVACRRDEDGVLVLSEFAGAAAELGEAVVVNPYDVDGMAAAIAQALAMSAGERQQRMRALRRRVMRNDSRHWADTFLQRLGERPGGARAAAAAVPPDIIAALRRAPHLILLLDYDGTLVPIANAPDLAVPDDDLMALLRLLAKRSANELHVVSGRLRDTLEGWFGDLPMTLWAEHGFWHRLAPGQPWITAGAVPADAFDRIRPILEQFTADTPGALVEQKTAAIAWHYRMADPGFGARQAHELRMLLGDALSNQPFEVLEGKKVIEVRLRGVTKAVVAHHIAARARGGAAVVVFGDDHTDEDLFRAVPEDAITIAVGASLKGATYAVDGPKAVREILKHFAG